MSAISPPAPQVVAECHGSRFDVTTGAVLQGPAYPAYEVREQDDEIQARV